MSKKITIKDIALLAGLSKTTVSRVLNNKPYVNEQKKQRVLDVIEETGFTPQGSAINLARGKTNIIGLLVPSLSNPYSLTVIQGVAEQIAREDFELMLYTTGLSEINQKQFLQKISKKSVDGLIVLLPRDSEEIEEQLHFYNMPTVLIDHRGIDTQLYSISVTNEKGAFDAAQYLISLGHKRIGMITGIMDFGCSRERLEGYKSALLANDIAFDQSLVVSGDFSESSGYQAALRFLENDTIPSAIFCSNDDMAIGAMTAFREKGLDIPQDISLVGFDDTARASMVTPALTTIKQPLFKMGETAAIVVKQLIHDEPVEHDNIVFNTELIVRDSCYANQKQLQNRRFV